MTPKEKAIELIDKFTLTVGGASSFKISFKKHALICVDELIDMEKKYNNGMFYELTYWQDVKKEIELL